MLDLNKLTKSINELVQSTNISDPDELNLIVDICFPSNSELQPTIEHLCTIKPFDKKPIETVTTFVKGKIRDVLIGIAYKAYQNKMDTFSIQEIKEELEDYYPENDEYYDDFP